MLVSDPTIYPFLAVCPFLLPSHSCSLLHAVSFLTGPASNKVLPPLEGGVGCPDTGNSDPAGSQEVVLPSLPLHLLHHGPPPLRTAGCVAERLTPYIVVWSGRGPIPCLLRSCAGPEVTGLLASVMYVFVCL